MIGFILAALAGVSLGLLGGGGSILIVPILIYSLSVPIKTAIALSLGIVGFTTLFGVFSNYKNINFKVAIMFSCTAIPATFLGSYSSQFISGSTQLLIFSVTMITAAAFMLKDRKEVKASTQHLSISLTLLSGFGVGALTGLIGVGGGFLIVPSLIYFTNSDMKKSVATSLLIISFNSFFGFVSYLDKVEIAWIFLTKFTAASAIGVLVGSKISLYIPQRILRKSFGFFLIIMGAFILIKNI